MVKIIEAPEETFSEAYVRDAEARGYEDGYEEGYASGFEDAEARFEAQISEAPDLMELARRAGFNILDGVWMRYDAASREVEIRDHARILQMIRVPYDGDRRG